MPGSTWLDSLLGGGKALIVKFLGIAQPTRGGLNFTGDADVSDDSIHDHTTVSISQVFYVSDLSSLQPTSGRRFVRVDGYAASGDGGDGLFYWDAAYNNVLTAVAIRPTGQSVGAWRRHMPDKVYSAAYFGVNSDGVTDAHAAIQAAINAVPFTGGQLGGGDVFLPGPAPPQSLYVADYSISRPIVVSTPGMKFRGARREWVRVKATGYRGPVICVAPNGYGPMPSTTPLLTGSGTAAVMTASGRHYLQLSDMQGLHRLRESVASGLNGLTGFSVECTVNVTPASIGSSVSANVIGCFGGGQFSGASDAFYIRLTNDGVNPNLLFGALVTINGSVHFVTIPNAVPFGVTTHLALCWDGTTLYGFVGAPGSTTSSASTSCPGTLTQDYFEEIYLGIDATSTWPHSGGSVWGSMPGTIDSIRISNFARHTANYTAPTAKYDTTSANNLNVGSAGRNTLMLLYPDTSGGDIDHADCFTVGYTWLASKKEPVYLLHRDAQAVGFFGAPGIEVSNMVLLPYDGHSIHFYDAQDCAVKDIYIQGLSRTSSGIVFENNSYRSKVERVELRNGQGLFGVCAFNASALVDWRGIKSDGCLFDIIVQNGVITDCLLGGTIAPIYLDDTGDTGTSPFTAIATATDSENLALSDTGGWKTIIAAKNISSVHVIGCQLEAKFASTGTPPAIRLATDIDVIVDSSSSIQPTNSTPVISYVGQTGLMKPTYVRASNSNGPWIDTTNDFNAPMFNDDSGNTVATVPLSGSTFTIDANDWSHGVVNFTGSLSGDCTVTVPKHSFDVKRLINSTTGGHNVIIAPTGGGTGPTIATNAFVSSDGTNIL